jgi:hypothetical protein
MVGHRLLSTPARLSILSLWVAKPAQALDLDRHRRLLVGAYGAPCSTWRLIELFSYPGSAVTTWRN